MALARGIGVDVRTLHVPDAMAELDAGNGERHDALIAAALAAWDDCRGADAIMLAQFSMARARQGLSAHHRMPVLVSTDSAVLALRQTLDG